MTTQNTSDHQQTQVPAVEFQQNTIFEYIRRRKGGRMFKVGVLVGKLQDKTVRIGWSKCNLKAGDIFIPRMGLQMAIDRTMVDKTRVPPMPLCIGTQARRFGARCIRYFKSAKMIELPN